MTDPDAEAFPLALPGLVYQDGSSEPPTVESRGMTIRELYAGLALQGILANPAALDGIQRATKNSGVLDRVTADISVRHADALIDALNKIG